MFTRNSIFQLFYLFIFLISHKNSKDFHEKRLPQTDCTLAKMDNEGMGSWVVKDLWEFLGGGYTPSGSRWY